MLYDNAQLLHLYADAHAATGAPRYASVASATADWIMRDMQSPQGGYYSTLDADSEHEEGKFYIWTPAEFDAVLSPDESALAKRVLGLAMPPNFEGKHWHLYEVLGAHRPALTVMVATTLDPRWLIELEVIAAE